MSGFAWTARQVAEALGESITWDHAYTGLSTDTRTLREGELFVALAGERFDAHDYLGDARAAGVGGVIVRRGTPRWPGFDWFEVDDTREALGRLARYRRDRFAGPVIAVTGTNGKTGTKELIAAALGARFRVHKSAGNLNNRVGVPLTVLAAPLEAEAMVVECGASLPGEVARLRDIVAPTVGVVTNVGPGHLEGFGGLDAVLAEKVSLVEGVQTAVVGTDPSTLPEAARGAARRVVTAGLADADWVPDEIALLPDGRPRIRVRGQEVTLPFRGRHMAANGLLALATADAVGVPVAEAAPALAGAQLPGGRSEIFERDGVTVIHDAYNANPGSLRAALELLEAVRAGRRAVVAVGTMRELGAESARLHRESAEAVLAAHPDLVVAVGEFADAFAGFADRLGPEALIAGPTPESVGLELKARLRPGDVLLLKASRGVQLERLLAILWPESTEAHAAG